MSPSLSICLERWSPRPTERGCGKWNVWSGKKHPLDHQSFDYQINSNAPNRHIKKWQMTNDKCCPSSHSSGLKVKMKTSAKLVEVGGLIIIFRSFGDLEDAFCRPFIFCIRFQTVAALVWHIQITVKRAGLSWSKRIYLILYLNNIFDTLVYGQRGRGMERGKRWMGILRRRWEAPPPPPQPLPQGERQGLPERWTEVVSWFQGMYIPPIIQV